MAFLKMKKKTSIIVSLFIALAAIFAFTGCRETIIDYKHPVTINFVTGTNEAFLSITRYLNEVYGELPNPQRYGYTFVGWWTTQNHGTGRRITETTIVNYGNNHNLYARWFSVFVTVNFVSNTLETISSKVLPFGGTYGVLSNPRITKRNHRFVGWFTCEINGELVTQDTIITNLNSHNLYARWFWNFRGMVSAGNSHSVAIDSYGNLFTWGSHGFGNSLGDGSTEDRHYPKQIVHDAQFVHVCVRGSGVNHAIDAYGYLWAWGNNGRGVLGDGTTTHRSVPVQIKPGTRFSYVSSINHTLAIDVYGNLWAWGRNAAGEIGDGTTTDRHEPVQIRQGTRFSQVSAAGGHSLALDVNGNLWVWGSNFLGNMGNGRITSNNVNNDIHIPTRIMQGRRFVHIDTNGGGSFAIDIEGNLWAWGGCPRGRVDGANVNYIRPVHIIQGTYFINVIGGIGGAIAQDIDGNFWAMGLNHHGTLGNGTNVRNYEQLRNPRHLMPFSSISMSTNHALALDKDGNFWSWGNNPRGQLGNGTTTSSLRPVQIIFN